MKKLLIGLTLLASMSSFANNCEVNELKNEFDSVASEQRKMQEAKLISELTRDSVRAYNIAKSRSLIVDGKKYVLPQIKFSVDENAATHQNEKIYGFSETRRSSCSASKIHTIDNTNKFFVKCVSMETRFPLTLLKGIVVHF
jgi:hypothetical protein